MAADRGEAGGRRRQIEQPIALGAALALDALQHLPDFSIGLVVVGIALDILDAAKDALDRALIDIAGGEFRQAFGKIGGEGFA